jgi:hypothetical protein
MQGVAGRVEQGGSRRLGPGVGRVCARCLIMAPLLVEEARVDEDTFNISVRKFLKTVGVTAQREIELAVREQLEAGELRGDETLEATARVTVRGLPDDVVVAGKIALS